MNPSIGRGMQNTASTHQFYLTISLITKSTSVECFENSSQKLLVLGNGVHIIDGAEEQRQRR